MVRRRPGALLALEVDLLAAAIGLTRVGQGDCYGYALAKALASGEEARRMVAHGTLYKALGRLTEAGFLDSWWEDAELAEAQARPRRRLYRITGAGRRAWSVAAAEARAVTELRGGPAGVASAAVPGTAGA